MLKTIGEKSGVPQRRRGLPPPGGNREILPEFSAFGLKTVTSTPV
jgi:hypothetical protein